jgi:hypothetical protein
VNITTELRNAIDAVVRASIGDSLAATREPQEQQLTEQGAQSPSQKTGTNLLREIDLDLWSRVKVKAEADGLTLRSVLRHLAEGYAAGRIAIVTHTMASAARANGTATADGTPDSEVW